MGGRIEIVHDDMFNGPSDLVVLPCSTIPTVASFVAERLKRFSIPFPRQAMRLGEVRFEQLTAATQLAPVAAYAASVKAAEGSDANAIEEIGRALGRHARDNASIRIIATPLLGTGAGKLNAVTALEALSGGFRDQAPDGATLRIFVLDEDVYASLERELPPKPLRPGIDVDMRGVRRANVRTLAPRQPPQPQQSPQPQATTATARGGNGEHAPIRAFISYTRTSDAHAAWVEGLGRFLRENGVDARLDSWDLSPGMDVAQWMCNELDLADRVLLICNEPYAQRADRRHGGVGWEIRLIQGDLLMSQQDNPDKFVPIVRTSAIKAGTPHFLRSVYCVHWPETGVDDARKRDDLLRTIYRIKDKPPLGRPPAFVLAAAS